MWVKILPPKKHQLLLCKIDCTLASHDVQNLNFPVILNFVQVVWQHSSFPQYTPPSYPIVYQRCKYWELFHDFFITWVELTWNSSCHQAFVKSVFLIQGISESASPSFLWHIFPSPRLIFIYMPPRALLALICQTFLWHILGYYKACNILFM